MLNLRSLSSLVLLAGRIALRARRAGPPRPRSLAQRIADFPRELPVREGVEIRWNGHMVPFVSARHDTDAAAALGAVHAHLRLGQIELMRRVARAELAAFAGPPAVPLDHMLRTMGVGRAVPGILEDMPEESRAWLGAFAAGINAAIEQARALPHDLEVMGLRPRPWTVEDLLLLGRIAAMDFTWKVWLRLLKLRERPDWMEVWDRLVDEDVLPVPSFAGAGAAGPLDPLLDALGRGGSNSYAVSGARSASGGALIASDPHLQIMLPNLWLAAGVRAPGIHAVGLMIPGVPVIALGRNPWIAWGGTSLHAASSEFFDVSGLDPSEVSVRQERIAVAGAGDKVVSVRETRYGPIVSDSPMLRGAGGRDLALHWVGHQRSDETTALMGVNRARDWEGFLSALEPYAVPALTMVFASADGSVGRAMAARLPRRPLALPVDLFAATDRIEEWDRMLNVRNLPHRLDPPEGFVASANEPPRTGEVPIGFFFAPQERVGRISQVLEGLPAARPEDLARLQTDVAVPSGPALRDLLLAAVRHAGEGGRRPGRRLIAALRSWDGAYGEDSPGALAFETLAYYVMEGLHGKEGLAVYAATWDSWTLLRRDLARYEPERLDRAIRRAVARASRAFLRLGTWGAAHRLRLRHPLAALPGLGRRYVFTDLPVGGGNQTVMKTAHGFTGGRHRTGFGANARHISDLSDPDANWFVLLGGQDGWMGSAAFLDQLPLWREGRLMRIPMTEAAVTEAFPHVTGTAP